LGGKDGSVMFHLAKGYQITRVLGKEFLMVLRDRYATPLAMLELYQDKITSVRPYRTAREDKNYLPVLQKFVRQYQLRLTKEAAAALELSVICRDGREEYLHSSELTSKRLTEYFRGYDTLSVYFNHFRKRRLVLPQTLKPCLINFSHARIGKIVVSPNSRADLDFRDNAAAVSLIIGDSFNGSLNFSRSALQKIKLGDNCRCNITCVRSGKCFALSAGDVFSGTLNISDSCFYRFDVGYYCYAVLRLTGNRGRKSITIGDSFRGTLVVDSAQVENLQIGDDCRGQITVRAENSEQDKLFNCSNPILLSPAEESLPAETTVYGRLIKSARQFWRRHFLL